MGGRILVVACALACGSTAFAQSTGAAESLFRDGRKLMNEGKYAEACRALEGSERLDHSVSTLMNLGFCREKEGKLATAWSIYLDVEAQTRDPKQATLNASAKKRAADLEPRLSYLTISVPDASRIPDLQVTRDGGIVDPAVWNSALPVDSGEHVVEGKAPGHEAWSTKIQVGEAERTSVEVPRFKVLVEVAPQVAVRPEPVIDTPPRSSFTTRRKIALGVAGGGVVIGGVALFLGASATGLRDDAVTRCPATSCSVDDASAAQALYDRGRDRALYANVGFAVAGVAVVGAVVLWLTGSPEQPSRVTVAPTLGEVNGFAIGGFL